MNVVDPAVLSVSNPLSALRPALTPFAANPTDAEPGHAESGASPTSAPADVPPATRRIPICARPRGTAASAATTTVVPSACTSTTSHATVCACAARPAAASARAGRIRGHAASRRDAVVPADAAAGTYLHPRAAGIRCVRAAAERCRAWNARWEPAGDCCGPEHGVRGSTCTSFVPCR